MSEPELQIIEPGSTVRIGGSIHATVLAVRIDPGQAITYLVAWWDGRARNEEWVYPIEIGGDPTGPRVPLGFFKGLT